MQIIIMHPRLKRARTVRLNRWWGLAIVSSFLLTVASASGGLSYLTLKYDIGARYLGLPSVDALRAGTSSDLAEASTPRADDGAHAALHASASAATSAFVRQNIDALAVKLGQLQAQITRLDVVGERVARMAGVRVNEPKQGKTPGQGGPMVPAAAAEMTLGELRDAVDEVALSLERSVERMGFAESELLYQQAARRLVPRDTPLSEGYMASRFGVRIDPLNGRRSMHEGLDFSAPVGTPIFAAGAGVVIYAGGHAAYGQHVDVDHGGGLVTRYAHASKLLVTEGDIVKQGQKIAEVGSTGRSTGPHLHFEVRVDNVPRDPLKYLEGGSIGPRSRRLASR